MTMSRSEPPANRWRRRGTMPAEQRGRIALAAPPWYPSVHLVTTYQEPPSSDWGSYCAHPT
jgi:hypothetical protein